MRLATPTRGLRYSKRPVGHSLLSVLVTALVAVSTAAGPDTAFAQSEITGRPIVFVHGICGGQESASAPDAWSAIRNWTLSKLLQDQPALHPNAASVATTALYFDGLSVRRWPSGELFDEDAPGEAGRILTVNEAPQVTEVVGEGLGQGLHSDVAAESCVTSAVDDPHTRRDRHDAGQHVRRRRSTDAGGAARPRGHPRGRALRPSAAGR